MRPADLITRMLGDDGAALLFDRRNDIEGQARAIGYDVTDCVQTVSPVAGVPVRIALLRPRLASADAKLASVGDRARPAHFIRLLDRFFVPAAGDPAVSALLFDLVAGRYEELTAKDVNRGTAEILLSSALGEPRGGKKARVLDFGCGTGFALEAAKRFEREGWDIELVGTDLSDAMLSIARGRGQAVMTLATWRTVPPESFDAAISCFVLHYGVPADDLGLIARQLKRGGVFSANLFKGDEGRVARLADVLGAAGLDLISNRDLGTTPDSPNRHLVFAKRDGLGSP